MRTVSTWVAVGIVVVVSLAGARVPLAEEGWGFGSAASPEATMQAANPSASPITAGFDHACGLTAEGEAWCWGSNDVGELGDGSGELQNSPVRVSGGHSFAQLEAGHNRSCGLTAAGAAFCWGKNAFGELGDGTFGNHRPEPAAVVGGHSFSSISVGAHHTCALTSGGEAWCWGSNRWGEVGDGTSENRTEPTRVATETRFTAISAGVDHTCALAQNGEAWCWGSNDWGELGIGSREGQTEPARLAGRTYASISAGQNRTCAVTAAGEAWCWGHNDFGALGDGSDDSFQTDPVRVTGDTRFASVSVGAHHVCGVSREGTALCWGHNSFAQIGDGTTTNRSQPTEVAGDTSFEHVSAGTYHTCGSSPAGEAWCWGRDLSVQDLREAGRVPSPTRVSDELTFGQRTLVGAQPRND